MIAKLTNLILLRTYIQTRISHTPTYIPEHTPHTPTHTCIHTTHSCIHTHRPLLHTCVRACHSYKHAYTHLPPLHTCIHAYLVLLLKDDLVRRSVHEVADQRARKHCTSAWYACVHGNLSRQNKKGTTRLTTRREARKVKHRKGTTQGWAATNFFWSKHSDATAARLNARMVLHFL